MANSALTGSIGTELASFNLLGQVSVACGHNTEINRDRACCSNGNNFSLLQTAQELCKHIYNSCQGTPLCFLGHLPITDSLGFKHKLFNCGKLHYGYLTLRIDVWQLKHLSTPVTTTPIRTRRRSTSMPMIALPPMFPAFTFSLSIAEFRALASFSSSAPERVPRASETRGCIVGPIGDGGDSQ
jgi:hypothetical protein